MTHPLPAVTPKSGAKLLLFPRILTILYTRSQSFNYFYIRQGMQRGRAYCYLKSIFLAKPPFFTIIMPLEGDVRRRPCMS